MRTELTYDFEPDPFEDEDYRVTCNRCGKRDLHWEETGNGWRLYHESGRRHNCLRVPASPDEFADCTPQAPETFADLA